MASEAEISQQDKPVYKKIIEYKKKISLVEGKRRAMFNKFEQEKSVNREKEKELDVELKVPQFNYFYNLFFVSTHNKHKLTNEIFNIN